MKIILSSGDRIIFKKDTIAHCFYDNITKELQFNYNIPIEDIPLQNDGLFAIGHVHEKKYTYLINANHIIGIDRSV